MIGGASDLDDVQSELLILRIIAGADELREYRVVPVLGQHAVGLDPDHGLIAIEQVADPGVQGRRGGEQTQRLHGARRNGWLVVWAIWMSRCSASPVLSPVKTAARAAA